MAWRRRYGSYYWYESVAAEAARAASWLGCDSSPQLATESLAAEIEVPSGSNLDCYEYVNLS